MGGVAQLGERRVRNAKVGSSILLVSTNKQNVLRNIICLLFSLWGAGGTPNTVLLTWTQSLPLDLNMKVNNLNLSVQVKMRRLTCPCYPNYVSQTMLQTFRHSG